MPRGQEPRLKTSSHKLDVRHNAQLAKLPELDHAALKQLWQSLLGRAPPSGMSRPLLRYALAYYLQEKTGRGLSAKTVRYLTEIHINGKPSLSPVERLKPGARLLREWHGHAYEVTVLKDGVQFKGKPYRSLSEVARVITGVRWSGPLFFGLKKGKVHG